MKTITPWRRKILRVPIILYRLRLGGLMGRRFLLLVHTGRKSGLARRTVLEIPLRDGPCIYLASGWGQKADWYRNLRTNPRARVILGVHLLPVDAEFLDPVESGHLMVRYANEHPRAARVLARLAGWVAEDQPAWYDLGHDHVPWVRLTVDR